MGRDLRFEIAAPMADTSNERLHALDAVRGFALIAGIIFHATVSFLPGPKGVPLWIVTDSQPSVVLLPCPLSPSSTQAPPPYRNAPP